MHMVKIVLRFQLKLSKLVQQFLSLKLVFYGFKHFIQLKSTLLF